MDNPLKSLTAAYAEILASAKRRALNGGAEDLMACAADPGIRDDDLCLAIWENPERYEGFCFPVFRGERVGPVRFWPPREDGKTDLP
jgi:hypothetical protein